MSNIVYTIIDESERAKKKHYNICLKAWKNWCKKYDTPIFIYEAPGDIDARWYKYKCFNILKSRGLSVEKILYVDADTIPSPKYLPPFDLTNKLGAVPNFGSLDHVIRSIKNYSYLFIDTPLSYTEYFNTGWMLFNQSHSNLLRDFCDWRKKYWEVIRDTIKTFASGEDQTYFNFFCKENNIEVDLLPFKNNIQDLKLRECFRPDAEPFFYLDLIQDGVWHFNANDYTKEYLEEVYEILWKNH